MPGTGVALAVVVGEGQVLGQVQRLIQRSANRFLQRLIHLVGQLDVEAGGGQAVIGRADLVTGAVHHAVIAIAAGVDGDVGGGDGDGADRVRHGGTIEILRLSRHAVGVHGVQGRFVVGVQAVVALAAVGVICSIGAGFGLRVGQLNGVGQLDRREVGHRDIDLPHKAFVGLAILTLLVVVQNKLIGPIAFGPKAVGAGHIGISIGGINEFFLIQLLPADSQRQRIQAVDKVEIVILTITNHVLHRRSFVQQIVNILLDLVKGNVLAVGKISHEGSRPGMTARCIGPADHGIAMILRGNFLIGLIGQIQRLIDGHSMVGAIVIGNVLMIGTIKFRSIRIVVTAVCFQKAFDFFQPSGPIIRSGAGSILGCPVIRACKDICFIAILQANRGRFLVVHVGNAIADKNQILAIGVHRCVRIQHGLASQQAGMGVGAAADLGLNCLNNSIHSGTVQLGQLKYPVGFLVEDNCAHFDRSPGVRNLLIQILKHLNGLVLNL